jgi:tetratricopeptide (TPR) repeat protein
MEETASRSGQLQRWLEQVDVALRTRGLEPAAQLALQALAEGVEDPTLLNLSASARYGEGRLDEAIELLTRARALAPADPNVLNSLGLCLKAAGRFEAALEAYDAALRIDPLMAPAHYNRGELLEQVSDVKAARSAYQQAIQLDPDYVEALASLAWLEAQAGDAASARMHGEHALALSPSHVLARMALASAALQQRDLPAAAAHLSTLTQERGLTPVNRSIVVGLIGDFQDASGRPAEAFAAYTASNAELKALHADQFGRAGDETALDRAWHLIDWFRATDREAWRDAPPMQPQPDDPRAHIFLVGFPRSGTTLLENVLASHPEVVALEEKPSLSPAADAYFASDESLERLATISLDDAARQRAAYWSLVRSFGVAPGGRVFIDKLPLASLQLPLIAKLFPNARILFARRDPRDVVLSCFRRRFAMNAAMYQLLTIEGAAAYYDAVMELSELYRGLLPLRQHIARYESLVDDFEGTAREACDFVGLEWDHGLFDFAAKARTRGIATPSAAQVARGLNREGQGTWRRYREQMAPVLPLVERWVERFGYEPT